MAASTGRIRLLRGVPFDNTYSDVRRFNTLADQTAYFMAFSDAYDSNYDTTPKPPAHPRIFSGEIDLPLNSDEWQDANYIMLQALNPPAEPKWFYGFVNEVSFNGNDNVAVVRYEIDSYQTYQFDHKVGRSFVEYEHIANDYRFANTLDEGHGEMTGNSAQDYNHFYDDYRIIVSTTMQPAGGPVSPEFGRINGQTIDRTYSALEYHEFAYNDVSGVNDFLSRYSLLGQLDRVIDVFMSPFPYAGTTPTPPIEVPLPNDLHGYVPRNKKLLGYPYCWLEVSNNQGDVAPFMYEGFATMAGGVTTAVNPQFIVSEVRSNTPACAIYPFFYQGKNYLTGNFDRTVNITNFPKCGWSGNVFANWIGQNAIGAIIGTGLAFAVNPVAGAIGVVAGVASAAKQAVNPSAVKGLPANLNVNWRERQIGFTVSAKAIPPELARVYDSQFDLMGYLTNEYKTPNFTGRQEFNFVKTRNCNISGTVPSQHMAILKSIYNNGVRLWHTDNIGNLSLPNGEVDF